MKVYLVYLPEYDTYSFSGYTRDVDAVFLDESKAKTYVDKVNKSIRDKQIHAYIVPLNTED
jgi:tRNA A58 N-methylase Trm61